MTNLEYTEVKNNYDYYREERNRRKNIHRENNTKSEMFTLRDWKRRSEHYMKTYIWDCGKGKFMNVGILERELNGEELE